MKKVALSISIIALVFIQNADCVVIDKPNQDAAIQEYLLTQNTSEDGFEDYLIISDYKIKSIKSSDDEVVSVDIVQTVMNDRNMIIVKANALGSAILTISFENKTVQINVFVKNGETILKPKVPELEYMPLDLPPVIEVGGL